MTTKASVNKKSWFGWVLCGTLLISVFWITQHFGYVINLTESLPHRCYVIHFKQKPSKGDFLVFKAPDSLGLPKNLTLTKQVRGVVGDRVTRQGRDFYVNGRWVGRAKTHSLQGKPLALGIEGIIPEGQYYVATDHKDSFDSRYSAFGWVSQAQCIGVAYALW